MRIALAQMEPTLGDVEANLARMRELTGEAAAAGADLVVFPELATHGYALGRVAPGLAIRRDDPRLLALSLDGADVLATFHEDAGVRAHNAAAYLSAGKAVHVQRKLYLPTYLVWEERKHSSPGHSLRAFDTRHGRAAVLICNDAWQPPLPWLAAHDGAELLLVPVNSAADLSESVDTIGYWARLLEQIARMQECWVVFVNRVGTEAGARFWGASRIVDPRGEVVTQAPLWEPGLVVAEIDPGAANRRRRELPLLAEARLGLVARELERLIAEGGDA
ncbi:MAG: nitrilase-related carbon-nitrogen hydrolase [Solirubrobacteraceae bacterium]